MRDQAKNLETMEELKPTLDSEHLKGKDHILIVLYYLRLPGKLLLWLPVCQYVYACISLIDHFY